jgi:Pyruvate/2-oxoacid:ferredoxin oxidoreductase delta subunit
LKSKRLCSKGKILLLYCPEGAFTQLNKIHNVLIYGFMPEGHLPN